MFTEITLFFTSVFFLANIQILTHSIEIIDLWKIHTSRVDKKIVNYVNDFFQNVVNFILDVFKYFRQSFANGSTNYFT